MHIDMQPQCQLNVLDVSTSVVSAKAFDGGKNVTAIEADRRCVVNERSDLCPECGSRASAPVATTAGFVVRDLEMPMKRFSEVDGGGHRGAHHPPVIQCLSNASLRRA
ncbi:hypothetical protein [Bradyrhizobium sp. AZCC 2230]|uniref:hypothetical protein n=1 Tax=Bradyrhizobium sp. AZCC 2230 TaxID=3117021 RepID=UPI002FF35751